MSVTPIVSAQRLGRRFGTQWAVAHLSFEIAAGEVVLIAGANGSGKTTLLRLICGLLSPSIGELAVFGSDPRSDRLEVRSQLTLVSHHDYLYDQLTASETLQLWNRLSPAPLPASDLEGLLELVDLERRAQEPVAGFSAGMRKRLSLLRVSIEDPDLVLLDEPFSALDPRGQSMIETWMTRLLDRGKTVLMASHAIERARPLADRAMLLRSGQIAWFGRAESLGAVT